MNWLIGLIIFTVGYLGGRRQGRKTGRRQGLAIAPLILRKQGLKSGKCVLCQAKLDNLSLRQEYDKLYRNTDFR